MPKKQIVSIAGFSLLELVLVVLIIGIISVTVAPQWTGKSLNLAYDAQRVLNDIRYAQALSVTTGQRYRWVKTSSNSYQIQNETGAAIVLPLGGTTLTLSTNTHFGALTNLPNSLVAFNSQGIPYINSAIPGTVLSSTAIILLTSSGGTKNIQISPETGYGVVQ